MRSKSGWKVGWFPEAVNNFPIRASQFWISQFWISQFQSSARIRDLISKTIRWNFKMTKWNLRIWCRDENRSCRINSILKMSKHAHGWRTHSMRSGASIKRITRIYTHANGTHFNWLQSRILHFNCSFVHCSRSSISETNW